MGNIVWGFVMVILGLSGNFVLVGTNSSGALVAAGAILMIWGALRASGHSQTTTAPAGQEHAEVHDHASDDDDGILMQELHDAAVSEVSRHGSTSAQELALSARPQIAQDVRIKVSSD